MIVHFGLDNLRAEWKSSTVCVGTFDGVHLGHQALVRETVRRAQENEQPSIVVTFDRHPRATLVPTNCPPAIGTLEQNVILLRKQGLSLCLIMPFDESLSLWPAERFFKEALLDGLKAERVVVGHDFAFGYQRHGDHDFLRSRIETHVVDPVVVDDVRVSSSIIRESVLRGDLSRANQLLGRRFALAGLVVTGQKLGRTIGYPTLNIARSMNTLIPPFGVYAGQCQTPEGSFVAAISIGTRQVVQGTDPTVEAYLLDYPGASLYGCPVELKFESFIRPQMDFGSLALLTNQIHRDVEQIRSLMKKVQVSANNF